MMDTAVHSTLLKCQRQYKKYKLQKIKFKNQGFSKPVESSNDDEEEEEEDYYYYYNDEDHETETPSEGDTDINPAGDDENSDDSDASTDDVSNNDDSGGGTDQPFVYSETW